LENNSQKETAPAVSIGLFVYNGEATLEKALDSLLLQRFSDFELIISDNASTDRTGAICERYAKIDPRIRYIRQDKNIGPYKNLEYVLDQARGEYFMWAAADDIRSTDYLEVNYSYLENHLDYVAPMSPNCYEGEEDQLEKLIDFSLEGGLYERLQGFLSNCWKSHGVFYSLARTSCLKNSDVVGRSYTAADWSVNVDLLVKGKIKRVSDGKFIIGLSGVSSSPDSYKSFRKRNIEYIFPLYEFSVRFIKTVFRSNDISITERMKLLYALAALNLNTAYTFVTALMINTIKSILRLKRNKQKEI